jgi:hypothetical protein
MTRLLFAGQPPTIIDAWKIPPAAFLLLIGFFILLAIGIGHF